MTNYTPEHTDSDGFTIPPTSECCGTVVLYLDSKEHKYIQFFECSPCFIQKGVCSKCNKEVSLPMGVYDRQ